MTAQLQYTLSTGCNGAKWAFSCVMKLQVGRSVVEQWPVQLDWVHLTFASGAAHEALCANLPNRDWDDLFVWSRELKVPLASFRG